MVRGSRLTGFPSLAVVDKGPMTIKVKVNPNGLSGARYKIAFRVNGKSIPESKLIYLNGTYNKSFTVNIEGLKSDTQYGMFVLASKNGKTLRSEEMDVKTTGEERLIHLQTK